MRSASSHAFLHVKRQVVQVRHYLLLMVMAVGLLGGTAGCVTTGVNPVSGNKRVYGYSWEEEKQLGAQSDQQIRAQFGVYEEGGPLQQYVDRVGQRVLQESALRQPDTPQEFRDTNFEFTVLDSPVVNAFALPGGYVYVTRGLMTHLSNEAQLAVVLGHEITHVAARHSSAQAGKQQLGQLGLLLGGLGAEAVGLPGRSIMQIGGTAAQLLFLEYSRDNEEESDDQGVKYAARAGYKASEGAEFFRTLERIQEKRGQALPTWQSTHPDPGNRRQRIPQLAQQYNEGTTVRQEEYLDQIEGTVMGENPRDGYVADGLFIQPDLALQFPIPRGFEVNNTPRAVQMLEQNQRAQMVFTFSQGSSPQQAAQQAAQQYRQQRGVNIVDSGSAQSSGNLPAYYLLVEGQNQQGQRLAILSYFVEYDEQVYVFQGVTGAQSFSQYENVFLSAMRGFGPVRDRSRLDVQPVVLDVQRIEQPTSFQRLVAGGYEAAGLDEQDLAIINQVELNQTINQGQMLKLPRRR